MADLRTKAIVLTDSATIVAGVRNKRIRVQALSLSASAAVNAKLQSGGGDITGLHYFPATYFMTPWVLPFINPDEGFWCECDPGEDLKVNLSSAVACGGLVVYSLLG